MSWKKNEESGAEAKVDQLVPSEHSYRLQLLIILKSWLTGWVIDNEVNAHKQRTDIVLTGPNAERYVLELVAHARSGPKDRYGTLQEHFVRSTEYLKALNPNEIWVVNFTTKPPNQYLWPESINVQAAHIYHTLAWEKVKITFKDTTVDVIP